MKSINIIKYAVAVILIIHAGARISLGIVDDLGVFLSSVGFPLGIYIAWVITLFEIIGSALIIANKYIKYLSAYFIIQLLFGIVLVHWQEGWFVVGAGRNGMELSILIICCFIVIILNEIQNQKEV